MNRDRWQIVHGAFVAALEVERSERRALVETLCEGDGALVAEALDLCAAHDEAGGFLETPVFQLLPAAAPGPSAERPERIGAYRVLSEIGRGGMGTVLLAERADEVFEKRVAIKVLRRELGRDGVRWFANERRALGDLEHPHIARIHDGGTLPDGRPYLVMEYVEGLRVDRHCDEHRLPVGERLRIFHDVCRAVEAAHRRLIVHGDLKPSNVLVTEDGEPRLIDFGICAYVDGIEPTRRLTPAYASPEHLRGEPLTVGSDVYSLGVLLCELLTGHRPFPVEWMEVATARELLEREPPPRPSSLVLRGRRGVAEGPRGDGPPTDPAALRGTDPSRLARQLRGDLDAIVTRALATSPGSRYSSVGDLAADVARHLARYPVSARRQTLRYRARKTVARHPLGTLLTALAPALAAGAMAASARSRHLTRLRLELAQHFSHRGRQLLEMRRRIRLLPFEEGSDARSQIEEQLTALEVEMARSGPLAVGPGSFALACGHAALDRHEAARRCLDQSLAAGFEPPEVSLLLSKTLWTLYMESRAAVDRIADESERRSRLSEIEDRFRVPALHHLKRAESAGAEELLYVQALIAYCDGDLDRCLHLARQAAAGAPWLYEARQLEGEVAVARAREAAKHGRIEEAEALLEEAGDAFRRALQVGRGDAQLWADEAERRAELFELRLPPPASPRISVDEVVVACRKAAAINPKLVGPKLTEARVHWRWADLLARNDQDPRRAVSEAIAAAERALELAPDSAEASHCLGMAAWVAVRWCMATCEDPMDWLAVGEKTLRRALRLHPRRGSSHNAMGNLLLARAGYVAWLDADPDDDLERAFACYRRAQALDPDNGAFAANIAAACGIRAEFDYQRGRDPLPWVELSRAAAAQAVESDSTFALTANAHLASVLYSAAAFHVYLSRDASALETIETLEKTLAEHRRSRGEMSIQAAVLTAEACRFRAWMALRQGQDPTQWLAAAIESLSRVVGHRMRADLIFINLAKVHLVAAAHDFGEGRSPHHPLERAWEVLRQARAAGGARYRLWIGLLSARAHLLQATFELAAGGDPSASLARASQEVPRPPDSACLQALAGTLEGAILELQGRVVGEADLVQRGRRLQSLAHLANPIAREHALGPGAPPLEEAPGEDP